MYLHGIGLQKHGPQNTNVLFLNTSLSNFKIGGDFRLQLLSTVIFVNVDCSTGQYFSGTAIVSNTKLPFTLQSSINQTCKSNIAGNQNFMWNVTLNYGFQKNLKRV